MTTTYTKIPKATGTPYTKISGGWHLYDDTMDLYDDPNVSFDGNNHSSGWTKITKANSNSTAVAGLFMGLGSLTYSGGQTLIGNIWTKIPKAN